MPIFDSVPTEKASPKGTETQEKTHEQSQDTVIQESPTNNEAEKPNEDYLWKSIGHGSYNNTWASNFEPSQLVPDSDYEGPWALKYPIPSTNPIINAMNDPNRGTRVWREVNHKRPASGLFKLGWVSPYVANTRPATDEEAARAQIDVYLDTRRIVADAATKGNFLTKLDTGEVILVDMDLALKRSSSEASFNFAKNQGRQLRSYWKDPDLISAMPITLTITQNLMYFEDQLDIDCVNELCKKRLLTVDNIKALTWLRENNKPLNNELFLDIATLCSSGIPVSDVLLESLALTVKQPINNTMQYKNFDNLLLFPPASSRNTGKKEQHEDPHNRSFQQ